MTLRKTLFFIIPLVLLLAALPAFGATLKGGEEVSLPQSENIKDDLYIGGGNVVVLGTVRDDLISVGGSVLVNGSVGADLMVAGGSVQVLSSVGDDARLAGGQVLVGDSVGGDAVAVGGDVKFLSSSTVRGDVVAAGGRVVLDGSIEGDARVWAGEVLINGSITGNVEIKADSIVIGEGAKISGDFTYSSPKEADISDGATILGETTFTERKPYKKDFPGAGVLFALGGALLFWKLLVTLVAALGLVLLFRRFTHTLSIEALSNFGKNTLLGFAVLVVTPIGLFLIAMTFVGALVAGIGALTYFLVLLLAKALVGVIAGALLAQLIKKEAVVDWKWATLGVVALQVVWLVPLVGWLITFAMFLVTLGALSSMAYRHIWVGR